MVARYEYDGLNRRVKKHVDTSAPSSPDGTIDEYRHLIAGDTLLFSVGAVKIYGPERRHSIALTTRMPGVSIATRHA